MEKIQTNIATRCIGRNDGDRLHHIYCWPWHLDDIPVRNFNWAFYYVLGWFWNKSTLSGEQSHKSKEKFLAQMENIWSSNRKASIPHIDRIRFTSPICRVWSKYCITNCMYFTAISNAEIRLDNKNNSQTSALEISHTNEIWIIAREGLMLDSIEIITKNYYCK